MNYKVVGEQFGDGPWVPVSQMKQKLSVVTAVSIVHLLPQLLLSVTVVSRPLLTCLNLRLEMTYPKRIPFLYNVTLTFSSLNIRRLPITMRDMVVDMILSQVKKKKVCSQISDGTQDESKIEA